MADYKRPDPDVLLSRIAKENPGKGRLKIFFGMSAGVGKTYAMLKEAHVLVERGDDVVIGWVESHGRIETDTLATGIERIKPKITVYRGTSLTEMDLDGVLARNPAFVLVDELAHTNAPGSRHPKRYQDVSELLDAGINVYTTINIQHLESFADIVEESTHTRIFERIPDSVFDRADDIQLIDIPPEELLQRLEEGKVYTRDKTKEALANFFKRENLAILRELSLRHTAQLASHQLTSIMRGEGSFLSSQENQRILVAVSPSPNSEYLIRWARRFSYGFKAVWLCLYVETGTRLSESQRESLSKNLTLARNLGATVVSFPGDNVVRSILEYAVHNNISMLIVGKSGKPKKGFFFGQMSFSERLMRESGTIPVISVQEKETKPGFVPRTEKRADGSRARQYIAGAIVITGVTLINLLITPFTGYLSAAIFYLAAISILALFVDRLPLLAVALLSVLAWDFLFIPPRFTFAISRIEDVLIIFLYFLLALTSSWMTSRLRANERMLVIREQRMSLINELSDTLETADGAQKAAEIGNKFITRAFRTNTIALLRIENENRLDKETIGGNYQPASEKNNPLDEKSLSAAQYCFSTGQSTGRFTNTLPVIGHHFVPMAAPGGTIGVIGIDLTNIKVWTDDQETFLLTLVSTISLAVQREILYERNRKNMLVRESERLSRILLNSISHELKTPLTVIQGSASALLDSDTINDSGSRAQLLDEILESTEKLNGIVENLLSMNRLESGLLNLKIVPADPEDILSIAIKQVKRELEGRTLRIVRPENLPLVPCDMLLIIQVVSNLLQNAGRYSHEKSAITIGLEETKTGLRFFVSDEGPGVKADDLPHIFEKFYKGERSTKGGTGLGLSICKGIIEAHNGCITALNPKEGGFSVEFTIPVEIPTIDKDTV
jgi:two-component system sensor histidine kinase KdpD